MKELINEIEVESTLDGSKEKNLFYFPPVKDKDVPLLVGLHSWSYDRFNQIQAMLPYCMQRKWALVLPEFRGPNRPDNPRALEACASKLARQDVIDATDYVDENYNIDKEKIMVLGGSGGGHMALMMAAYAPEKWAAVSSWCPITDLAKWREEKHKTKSRYASGIEACCDGIPGDSDEVDNRYEDQSPVTHAEKIAKANVSVHHGRFDKSVPYTHTMDIIEEVEKHNPENFYFEIFDGGHELIYDQAFKWLKGQLEKQENSKIQEKQQITG